MQGRGGRAGCIKGGFLFLTRKQNLCAAARRGKGNNNVQETCAVEFFGKKLVQLIFSFQLKLPATEK